MRSVQWVPALGHDRAMRYRIHSYMGGAKRCGRTSVVPPEHPVGAVVSQHPVGATDPERMGTCMSHREAQASNQARRHHMRQVAWRNRNEARGSSLSTGSGVPAESSYWNQFKDPTSHVAVSISRDASMEPTAPPAAPVTISGIEWAAHISRRHQEVYGADR